jgi:hypothetical protein
VVGVGGQLDDVVPGERGGGEVVFAGAPRVGRRARDEVGDPVDGDAALVVVFVARDDELDAVALEERGERWESSDVIVAEVASRRVPVSPMSPASSRCSVWPSVGSGVHASVLVGLPSRWVA